MSLAARATTSSDEATTTAQPEAAANPSVMAMRKAPTAVAIEVGKSGWKKAQIQPARSTTATASTPGPRASRAMAVTVRMAATGSQRRALWGWMRGAVTGGHDTARCASYDAVGQKAAGGLAGGIGGHLFPYVWRVGHRPGGSCGRYKTWGDGGWNGHKQIPFIRVRDSINPITLEAREILPEIRILFGCEISNVRG